VGEPKLAYVRRARQMVRGRRERQQSAPLTIGPGSPRTPSSAPSPLPGLAGAEKGNNRRHTFRPGLD